MISGIGYDPESKTCHVAFKQKKNGLVTVETLPNMEPEEFNRFQNAASFGQYFIANYQRKWSGIAKAYEVTPEEVA